MRLCSIVASLNAFTRIKYWNSKENSNTIETGRRTKRPECTRRSLKFVQLMQNGRKERRRPSNESLTRGFEDKTFLESSSLEIPIWNDGPREVGDIFLK